MTLPGWSTVWGVGAKIINNFIPSKKGALSDKLASMNVSYRKALEEGRDTDASTIRKQMEAIREKANLTDGDM
ncbi:MAG: hypothetical protein WCS56_00750 [Bacilli bacterium]